MKIAIIEPVGGHGGMNYYDIGLANGLSHSSIETILYTSDVTATPTNASFKVVTSFKKIWNPSPKINRAFRFFFCLLKTLSNALKNKVDIVHYHFFHYTLLEFFCIYLAKIFSFKIVVTVHDVESFAGLHSDAAAKIILGAADKLIAHNKLIKDNLVAKVKLPSGNIQTIPHGNYVDFIPNKISGIEAKKQLGIPIESKTILFFGQIKKVKGLDVLLNAFANVLAKDSQVRLVVAGKLWKDNISDYQKIINEKKLSRNLDLFLRYITDEEVPLFYNASDIIVLPYRKIYQSGVLLMAMSYGRPVIVSDIDGMTEIVKDNKNGFIFKSEDIEDLAKCIIRAFSDPTRLGQVAEAGFNTVIKHHDWLSIGKQTADLYSRILES